MKLLASIAIASLTVLVAPGAVPEVEAAVVAPRTMHQCAAVGSAAPVAMTVFRRGPEIFEKCCSLCESHQKYCWQRCKKGC